MSPRVRFKPGTQYATVLNVLAERPKNLTELYSETEIVPASIRRCLYELSRADLVVEANKKWWLVK